MQRFETHCVRVPKLSRTDPIFLVSSLQPLTNLTMLEDLELYDCPVRTNARYHIQMESWFPNTYFTPGFADSESDRNSFTGRHTWETMIRQCLKIYCLQRGSKDGRSGQQLRKRRCRFFSPRIRVRRTETMIKQTTAATYLSFDWLVSEVFVETSIGFCICELMNKA